MSDNEEIIEERSVETIFDEKFFEENYKPYENDNYDFDEAEIHYLDKTFVYSYKPYMCTKETVKTTLNTYGVAVIPNVLNKEEIRAMNDGMWDTLELLTEKFETPIKRTNPYSWVSHANLLPNKYMLMQYWKIGHAQYVWDVRQNEKLVDIWSTLWNCKNEDLITSFDGVSCHLPYGVGTYGYYNGSDWLHLDQSYRKKNFACVQGQVVGNHVFPGDATLTFLQGSHKYHSEVADFFSLNNEVDWFVLEDQHLKYYLDKGCVQRCITCPAGSLILWDSRTVHSGQEPFKSREKDNIRNVAYVCMMPKHHATEEVIQKRITAFENMQMTTHWATQGILFPKEPRVYYKSDIPDVGEISPPKLTELGRKLVGYE